MQLACVHTKHSLSRFTRFERCDLPSFMRIALFLVATDISTRLLKMLPLPLGTKSEATRQFLLCGMFLLSILLCSSLHCSSYFATAYQVCLIISKKKFSLIEVRQMSVAHQWALSFIAPALMRTFQYFYQKKYKTIKALREHHDRPPPWNLHQGSSFLPHGVRTF